MDTSADFGAWLAVQLRLRDMRGGAFARRVGVTPAAVSAWTTNRAKPRPDMRRAIEQELADIPIVAADTDTLTWYHRPAHPDGGRELGNAAAFAFDTDLGVLAREATQNSLDERLDDEEPIRVRYTLHELTGDHLRDFLEALRWDSIEPHVTAAASRSNKVGRIITHGLEDLRTRDRLLLLRIDDHNASGLTGPEYEDGRFSAVLRRQLDSYKNPNAGGSYGLGKVVLWATSALGLVLVNSTLSEPEEGKSRYRMIGRLELPWRQTGDRQWAGPAWFGEPDAERDGATRSWWGDPATAGRLHLDREDSSPGTSFLIVGAHDPSGDADTVEEMHTALVEGLAANFWASMVATADGSPMLEASVVTKRNGEIVIKEERIDPYRAEPDMARALRSFLDGTTVSELTGKHDVAQVPVPLTVPPLKSEQKSSPTHHQAILLITRTEGTGETSNQLVGMRSNRMVVMRNKITDVPLGSPPVQAVLLAGRAAGATQGSTEAELFLRSAEPPEHNDWKRTDDLTSTYARGAARRITEFRRAIKDAIQRVIRPTVTDRDEIPAVLRGLLDLDVPPAPRSPGFPTVKNIHGSVNEDGAWHINAEVRLPPGTSEWLLDPVLCFVTRSGPRPSVEWAELVADLNCEVTDSGNLRVMPGERTATFSGVTDPLSHPVAADMAAVELDLRRKSEVAP